MKTTKAQPTASITVERPTPERLNALKVTTWRVKRAVRKHYRFG